jgi:hypothetical protein
LPSIISGAWYCGVPRIVYKYPDSSLPRKGAANPKSAIFKLKFLSRRRLSGLRSL